MSKINDGGPAFPSVVPMNYKFVDDGMSLRDYFAIHADQPGAAEIVTAAGLTYSEHRVWENEHTAIGTFDQWYRGLPAAERFRLYASVRYAIADALLAARDAGQP